MTRNIQPTYEYLTTSSKPSSPPHAPVSPPETFDLIHEIPKPKEMTKGQKRKLKRKRAAARKVEDDRLRRFMEAEASPQLKEIAGTMRRSLHENGLSSITGATNRRKISPYQAICSTNKVPTSGHHFPFRIEGPPNHLEVLGIDNGPVGGSPDPMNSSPAQRASNCAASTAVTREFSPYPQGGWLGLSESPRSALCALARRIPNGMSKGRKGALGVTYSLSTIHGREKMPRPVSPQVHSRLLQDSDIGGASGNRSP